MRTVSSDEVASDDLATVGLPERVQEALGELAGAAKEGLLALSVGVGLGVLHELVEAEVDEVVGPKGKHDPGRRAVRHGHQGGEVTLGGRRVPVERPRARAVDGSGEVELQTYRHFAERDALTDVVLERMLAGVSTRRYARAGEPVGDDIEDVERSTSRSAVSREFVSRTRENLIALMSRPLGDLRLAVLMLDGVELKGRCCVVALGIDSDGVKHPLGLWDGSTENATVATTLLANPHRAWPRRRARRALRDRRRQGASQGDPRCARDPHPGAALFPPQGAHCARPPARTRPPADQAPAARGVDARRPRRGAGAPARPGRRA